MNSFKDALEILPRVREGLVGLLLKLFSEGLEIVVEIRISNLMHDLLLRQNVQIDSHEGRDSELFYIN